MDDEGCPAAHEELIESDCVLPDNASPLVRTGIPEVPARLAREDVPDGADPVKPEMRESFLRLHREHVVSYSVVSLDPPVFLVMLELEKPDLFFARYHRLFSALGGRRSYCLCAYSWNVTPKVLDSVRGLEARAAREYPDLRLIHLCNVLADAERFAALGAQAVHCNHNCFLDEAVFKPLPSVEKRFDAVYDARLVEWKRHRLARDIERLALIYYPILGEDEEFGSRLRRELAHAHFFNDVGPRSYRMLQPEEVNEALNACRVGLCLSAEEVAMYASTQYLLSGLAVATTPSLGGRDVFFDERFVATVAPEPGAIREAVAELIGRRLDPWSIRQATLDRIAVHRQRFVSVMQEIYAREGVPRDFADEWPDVFCNKMVRNHHHEVTLARIRKAREGRPG